MDLTPYIENLRRELATAAEAGGDEARALAERLTAPLDSATRLALLEALSAAAEEITSELAPGSVDVRLRGRDPEFVVTQAPTEPGFNQNAEPEVPPTPDPLDTEDGGTSRVTLRLPEQLKPRIEDAAGQAGLSVNAWLVRAVTAALRPTSPRHGPPNQGSWGGMSYTGWVR